MRGGQRLPVAIWCTVLVGALWFLHLAGRGELASPPIDSWTQLADWPAQVGLKPLILPLFLSTITLFFTVCRFFLPL